MKPGFCYVTERVEPSQAARRIIASFSRVGIVLVNSHTGRVTELAEDGEQVATTEASLLEAAAVRPELSFQLWFSSDTDVACGFRQIAPGIVGHGYSLSGLDARERDRLTRWAVDYFREAAADGTAVLLVVDPAGVTEDVDWDAVVRQAMPFPAALPAILGLPASWMKHLGVTSGYSQEFIADFVLLRSQSLPGDDMVHEQ
jgi:hypothetical protein